MTATVRSMTGFGHAEFEDASWRLRIEIRTLNHRYFNWNFQAPPEWAPLEPELLRRTKTSVARGDVRVTAYTRYFDPDLFAVELRSELLQRILDRLLPLRRTWPNSPPEVHLDGLLRLPGLVTIEVHDREVRERFRDKFFETYDQALGDLVRSREEEGETLCRSLQRDLNALERLLRDLESDWDHYLDIRKEKYVEQVHLRLQDLDTSADEARIASEIALWLQKADAREELDRLIYQLTLFRRTLEQPPCGRKLEFITQEMVRESQTLGAKFSATSPDDRTIRIKTLVDRLRQQVQNIE